MYIPAIPANYFLEKSIDAKKPITPIKLELLVYFAHAWHLAIVGKSLINESIHAWRHGPVIESIHLQYNKKGVNLYDTIDSNLTLKLKKIDKFFLDGIWRHYRSMNDQEMIAHCYEPNSPWASAYAKSSKNIVIENLHIKKYYRWLIATNPDFADLEDDPDTEYSDVG